MNLVSFSIRTKGIHNFGRRLWTVFSRFGFSEDRMRKSLTTIVSALKSHDAAPTFFIPAVVLQRHVALIAGIAGSGAEIGVHGYVHTDFRSLSKNAQYKQTQQAITVFQKAKVAFQGFRNPYLGWTEEALHIFADLGFSYESNEAVFHDIVDLEALAAPIKSGYMKSLKLYQAQPCNAYALRPHFEDKLLRIPTSIPDDEMLFDRLRITDAKEVGRIWSTIMERVYSYHGVFALNLHPERGVLCAQALTTLLTSARQQPLPIWLARLDEIATWWNERRQFRFSLERQEPARWSVQATCTGRATILARHLSVPGAKDWYGPDQHLEERTFSLQTPRCPCIGVSARTPQAVADFLHEQGYALMQVPHEGIQPEDFAFYVDMPDGLGNTREEQFKQRSSLVQQIEDQDAPLLHFGNWPERNRAALAISGDIDSITVQDFFLRILEVSKNV